jgi:hypothetical protein
MALQHTTFESVGFAGAISRPSPFEGLTVLCTFSVQHKAA